MPQEPRQATAATQPFPRGDAVVPQFIEIAPEGSTLVNDGRIFTPFVGTDPTIVAPGIWGGASWPPSAYDPAQQRLFVCASSVISGYTGGGDPKFVPPTPGVSFGGGKTTFTRTARTGIIAALDVTTNKIAWRYQWPEQCYSGTLATGRRAAVRRPQRRAPHGARLGHAASSSGSSRPAPACTRPSSTFERNGKQYVLAFSAGSALIGSARGDSVWLFALDGTLPPVQPGIAGVTATRRSPAPPAATSERSVRLQPDVAAGRQLYAQACEVCHGADGAGGHGGGASLVALKDLAATIQTVTAGRNNMPPFSASFTPEQIRDVSAYVVGTLAGRSVP